MLVISRGTDDASGLIEHQVAGCACLGGLAITTHIAEAGDYLVDIGGGNTVNLNPALRQQKSHVAALDIQQGAGVGVQAWYGLVPA